jgi:hypothetical protein
MVLHRPVELALFIRTWHIPFGVPYDRQVRGFGRFRCPPLAGKHFDSVTTGAPSRRTYAVLTANRVYDEVRRLRFKPTSSLLLYRCPRERE